MKDKMNFKEYKEWLKNSFISYALSKTRHIQKIRDGKETTIMNTRTGKMSKAFCNSEDVYDVVIGTAIAWAKYCGRKIPEFVDDRISIKNLKIGQRFMMLEFSYYRVGAKIIYVYLGETKDGFYEVKVYNTDKIQKWSKDIDYKVFPVD